MVNSKERSTANAIKFQIMHTDAHSGNTTILRKNYPFVEEPEVNESVRQGLLNQGIFDSMKGRSSSPLVRHGHFKME